MNTIEVKEDSIDDILEALLFHKGINELSNEQLIELIQDNPVLEKQIKRRALSLGIYAPVTGKAEVKENWITRFFAKF